MTITLCFYTILAEDNDRGGDHLYEHFEWEDWMWNIVRWYWQYFSPHSLNKSSFAVAPAVTRTFNRSSLNWKGPTTLNTETAKHKKYAIHAHCSFAKWDRILWEIFSNHKPEKITRIFSSQCTIIISMVIFFCVAFYFSFIFMLTYIYYYNIIVK